MNTVLEIFEEDGFLGLVNNELYDSFVHEDWELDELLKHFLNEMNEGNCLIWHSGAQNRMTVSFTDEVNDRKCFREAVSTLAVTSGRLYLVSYTDLTMAAQFDDEKLPSANNSQLYTEIENGNYEVRIQQMFDPQNYDCGNMPDPCFILTFSKITNKVMNEFTGVLWWK